MYPVCAFTGYTTCFCLQKKDVEDGHEDGGTFDVSLARNEPGARCQPRNILLDLKKANKTV